MARPTSSEVPGCAGCALTTTGQPAASAEAVSPPPTEKASGKLLAPNTATGPMAMLRRRRSERGSGLRSGIAGSIRTSSQLPSRTTEAKSLSWFTARARQAAFQHRALDERVADADDALGDGLQELRAGLVGGLAILVERGGRECARAFQVRRVGATVWRIQFLAGRGIDATDRGLASRRGGFSDELLA